MKHLKTYEGLFDFFKKKKEVTKRNFEITDDLYQTVSEILQDADLMGLEVSTQITGRGNIYSMIDRRVEKERNTGLGGAPISKYYNKLKDYDLYEMYDILSRLIDYVRSESENILDVTIDFIDNGPHSDDQRLTNPSDELILNQLKRFYHNFAYDWKYIYISVTNPNIKRGSSSTGPR